MSVALATFFTFSADTVKAAFETEPKYERNLRLFRYGAMQFDPDIAALGPRYVTDVGSVSEDPLQSWYNASAATTTVTGQNAHGDQTAFTSFSATCLYFGVELLDALGKIVILSRFACCPSR